MEISQETKNKYINGNTTKNLVVEFPSKSLTIEGVNIYSDSMRLSENLFDTDSIEFIGCIASKFEVDIRDLGVDVKGERIYAYIYTGDNPNDRSDAIPLFHGIVDEVKMQSNHRIKHIVAYDELYTKGNIDVSNWYKGLQFGKNGLSLGYIRKSLLQTMNLTYEDKVLPNDNIIIKKQYNPSSLQALAVLKSICQINGVFGMIGRDGRFRFLVLPEIAPIDGTYPGQNLYPPFYPANKIGGSGDKKVEPLAYYRSIDYQEYSVKPIDMVVIRQSSEDDGGSYLGEDVSENGYIIQGNMFTLNLKTATLEEMAYNIYPNVRGFSYTPYTSTNNGLPWIECGQDIIHCYVYDFLNSTSLQDVYAKKDFYILNREMSGIQNLQDTYSVKGDEYQKIFISDIGVNIDVIQKNIQNNIEQYVDENLENYYDKEEINQMFDEFDPGGETGWSVESVQTLPAQGQSNVLYLIQGEVVVE